MLFILVTSMTYYQVMVNGGDDSGGFYERFLFFFGDFKLKDTETERNTSLEDVVSLSEVTYNV